MEHVYCTFSKRLRLAPLGGALMSSLTVHEPEVALTPYSPTFNQRNNFHTRGASPSKLLMVAESK